MVLIHNVNILNLNSTNCLVVVCILDLILVSWSILVFEWAKVCHLWLVKIEDVCSQRAVIQPRVKFELAHWLFSQPRVSLPGYSGILLGSFNSRFDIRIQGEPGCVPFRDTLASLPGMLRWLFKELQILHTYFTSANYFLIRQMRIRRHDYYLNYLWSLVAIWHCQFKLFMVFKSGSSKLRELIGQLALVSHLACCIVTARGWNLGDMHRIARGIF